MGLDAIPTVRKPSRWGMDGEEAVGEIVQARVRMWGVLESCSFLLRSFRFRMAVLGRSVLDG